MDTQRDTHDNEVIAGTTVAGWSWQMIKAPDEMVMYWDYLASPSGFYVPRRQIRSSQPELLYQRPEEILGEVTDDLAHALSSAFHLWWPPFG